MISHERPSSLILQELKWLILLAPSPLGDVDSVSLALDDKIAALVRMGDRLTFHDALVLLRSSFSIPKLQYLLRTAPCFKSQRLQAYDDGLRLFLCAVVNINLGPLDSAWFQACLPVRLGGLGLQSAVKLAPSAFLASSHATADLVRDILLVVPSPLSSALLEDTLAILVFRS